MGVNVEPFWPDKFAKDLASANTESLICNEGAGGPDSETGAAPSCSPVPFTASTKKRKQRKKNLRNGM